jgi:hypothetical protein
MFKACGLTVDMLWVDCVLKLVCTQTKSLYQKMCAKIHDLSIVYRQLSHPLITSLFGDSNPIKYSLYTLSTEPTNITTTYINKYYKEIK